jgi:hypothetical protein
VHHNPSSHGVPSGVVMRSHESVSSLQTSETTQISLVLGQGPSVGPSHTPAWQYSSPLQKRPSPHAAPSPRLKYWHMQASGPATAHMPTRQGSGGTALQSSSRLHSHTSGVTSASASASASAPMSASASASASAPTSASGSASASASAPVSASASASASPPVSPSASASAPVSASASAPPSGNGWQAPWTQYWPDGQSELRSHSSLQPWNPGETTPRKARSSAGAATPPRRPFIFWVLVVIATNLLTGKPRCRCEARSRCLGPARLHTRPTSRATPRPYASRRLEP